MKAIQFAEKNNVQLTDLADPKPQSDEVVLRVEASGICHTDIEILRGNYGVGAFPLVPGHEYTGTIVEIGADVARYAIGDRVVVDPNLGCGVCEACKNDRINLCVNLGAYGVTQNGGFAQYSVVKASHIHTIGDLNFQTAALAEPMGCVLNGIDAVFDGNQSSALIFGGGPIGILMAMALKVHGVKEVSVADISEERLELIESFGFTPLRSAPDILADYRHSFDLVVDATGVLAVAQSVIEYIANGGRGLFFGVCEAGVPIKVEPFELFRRQITLAGTHSLNQNIPEALDLVRKVGPDIERLISHQLPIDEIAQVLKTGAPKGSLKIQASFAE